jgi:hypothetical protein
MSHEAKPHLPGAVLMLAAVWFGMRHLENVQSLDQWFTKSFWVMCICCGAALGMVLSSWPIFVLIPLVAWMDGTRRVARQPHAGKGGNVHGRSAGRRGRTFIARTIAGASLGAFVYLITNPYIVINMFTNRAVLKSNFGNSLAMYEISRIGEGFVRVLRLTVEGATLPILVLGVIALIAAISKRHRVAFVLIVPAAVFFLQFVLIGAGKPAEYGRFGIFTNTALGIGTACVIAVALRRGVTVARGLAVIGIVFIVLLYSAAYLRGFWEDTTSYGSRARLASTIHTAASTDPAGRIRVGLRAEPAPYSCPPLNFANAQVILLPNAKTFSDFRPAVPFAKLRPVDHLPQKKRFGPLYALILLRETPISWADKPFDVQVQLPP